MIVSCSRDIAHIYNAAHSRLTCVEAAAKLQLVTVSTHQGALSLEFDGDIEH